MGGAVAEIGEADRLTPAAFRQADGLGARTPLALATPVDLGDRLTTDRAGRLGILLDDGSRLTLGPNSEIVLDAFSFQATPDDRLGIALGQGVLRFVTGRMQPAGIEIATPSATLGIRGTDVVIAVAGAGTTRIIVLDGAVRVERDDGQASDVFAGSSAIVSPGLPSIAISDVVDAAIVDPIVEFDDAFDDDDFDEDEIEEDLEDDLDEETEDERDDDFDGDDDFDDDDDDRDDENDDSYDDDGGSDDNGSDDGDDDGNDDDDDGGDDD